MFAKRTSWLLMLLVCAVAATGETPVAVAQSANSLPSVETDPPRPRAVELPEMGEPSPGQFESKLNKILERPDAFPSLDRPVAATARAETPDKAPKIWESLPKALLAMPPRVSRLRRQAAPPRMAQRQYPAARDLPPSETLQSVAPPQHNRDEDPASLRSPNSEPYAPEPPAETAPDDVAPFDAIVPTDPNLPKTQLYPPQHMSRDELWRQFSANPVTGPHGAEHNSLSSTLKNGFWFAGLDFMFLEPIFQSNQAIQITNGSTGTSTAFDFGIEMALRGNVGFESNAGPAIEFTIWQYNEFSPTTMFTSDGTSVASLQATGGQTNNTVTMTAANNGASISAREQLKILSTDLMFYKDLRNRISRIRGNVGMRYTGVTHRLFANLNDPATVSSELRTENKLDAYGPKIGVEYFRPLGNTPLELQAGLFGSLLFARRDLTIDNVGTFAFRQSGRVESLTILDVYVGLQWNRELSNCRKIFVRSAVESQSWLNGDSAIDTAADFGLFGFSFGVGVAR